MPYSRHIKVAIWAGMLAGFVMLTFLLSMSGTTTLSRLIYLWSLFAVCISPCMLMREWHDRYALLWIMLAVYFVMYGVSDVLMLISPVALTATRSLAAAELAIVVGALALLFGYWLIARRDSGNRNESGFADWKGATVFLVGITFWALGVLATLYWQVKLQARSFSLGPVSPALGMAVTLGRMVQPLGTALIAYQTVKSRSKAMLMLILILLALEFVMGFVCDSKELSIRGMIILLAAKILIDGRVPKIWLATGAVITVLAFPVFQAYRHEVLGLRGQAREQAAHNLKENLTIALQSLAEPGAYGNGAGPGFIGRVSLKNNMVLVIERVGEMAPYQNGYTYLLFLEGLVPRVLWPEKPDTSVGQLFNRELQISAFRDVYISPSYLGEFYWNFGWMGITVGMLLLGAMLGAIGRQVSMVEGVTVTRFLVLLLTVYSFCMRFEGGIALEALVWVRSLLAVAILHWLFANRTPSRQPLNGSSESTLSAPVVRLENLMH